MPPCHAPPCCATLCCCCAMLLIIADSAAAARYYAPLRRHGTPLPFLLLRDAAADIAILLLFTLALLFLPPYLLHTLFTPRQTIMSLFPADFYSPAASPARERDARRCQRSVMPPLPAYVDAIVASRFVYAMLRPLTPLRCCRCCYAITFDTRYARRAMLITRRRTFRADAVSLLPFADVFAIMIRFSI